MQKREEIWKKITSGITWDVLIIGGGATGLGCAVDAASRGLKTLLIEKQDFASGTSSRSTKLIHGGVRYLRQGNLSLVLEALHERGLLIQNAPHLVHHQSFIVPVYEWWEGPFYGAGLKVYDLLAGKLGLKPSRLLSRDETINRLPTIDRTGLKGGVMYYDGQFDDSRLAIHLAQTATDLGATVINYTALIRFKKEFGILKQAVIQNTLTGEVVEIQASVFINATGVFADSVLQLDQPDHENLIQPSQGIHLVLDRSFHPGDAAIMVPHTEDGRVLFAVPWLNRVIVGTTDTAVDRPSETPVPLDQEIDFLLRHASRYLQKSPTRKDVLSMFAGLRPLIKSGSAHSTAEISRDHSLLVSNSGLLTITGGKWTTYRRMAQDTIDKALVIGGFGERPCKTEILAIHGAMNVASHNDARQGFGTDLKEIEKTLLHFPERVAPLHPNLPYLEADVYWAIEHEMAQTLEDVLSRRTRCLLLDARATQEIAPRVSQILAQVLGKDENWRRAELENFLTLTQTYLTE